MENNNINEVLDTLAISEGDLLDSLKVVPKDEIKKKLNKLSYEENVPIPGQSIDNLLNNQLDSINENSAMNDLVMKSANIKAKHEAELGKTLTKEEKAKQRQDFIETMLYQQGEAYFEKYHYIMDGKTKRRTRKMIERNYDKGRYKKYINGGLALN